MVHPATLPQNNFGEHLMKLSVCVIWNEGSASYYIQDIETKLGVVDIAFTTEPEAQAYLNAHREEIERKGLPPLSPEDVEDYWRVVELAEKKQLKESDRRIAKKFLLRLARQPTPLDKFSLRRIESAIARLDVMDENARTEAAKLTPEARESETMLELAQSYFEMGDKEGALEILNEVVQRGDGVYRKRARKMIAEIYGRRRMGRAKRNPLLLH